MFAGSGNSWQRQSGVWCGETCYMNVRVCSTAVAIRGKDGVVFGVEKLVTSKLYEKGANKRIFNVDRHVGMVRRRLFLFIPQRFREILIDGLFSERYKSYKICRTHYFHPESIITSG